MLELAYSPADADVDFVFIHGLNGGAIKTWTADNVFWPKDLLPAEIPHARVLAFGYDAQVVHFWSEPSQNRIDNHADALFAELSGVRDRTQTNERPLIFVAHSLGGLVCAQALLIARSGPAHIKNIARHTRSIAFLGTPHAGSSKAAWAEMGRRFTEYVGLSSNTELVKNLDIKSETLARLGRDFPSFLEDRLREREEIEVMCFFEGKKFKIGPRRVDKIVPEESACLAGKQRLSLYADHSEMCKYEDKEDQNYRLVVDVLGRWARAAGSPKLDGEVGMGTINNVQANFANSNNYAFQAAQVTGPINMSGWQINPKRDPGAA